MNPNFDGLNTAISYACRKMNVPFLTPCGPWAPFLVASGRAGLALTLLVYLVTPDTSGCVFFPVFCSVHWCCLRILGSRMAADSHVEAPAYLMAKPEIFCASARASWRWRLLSTPSYLSGTYCRENMRLWGVPVPCEVGGSTDGNLDQFTRRWHYTNTWDYLY